MESCVNFYSNLLSQYFKDNRNNNLIQAVSKYNFEEDKRPFVYKNKNDTYMILFSENHSNLVLRLENNQIMGSFIYNGINEKKVVITPANKYLILDQILNIAYGNLSKLLLKLEEQDVFHHRYINSFYENVYLLGSEIFIGVFYGIIRYGKLKNGKFEYEILRYKNLEELYRNYKDYIMDYIYKNNYDVLFAAKILCQMKQDKS